MNKIILSVMAFFVAIGVAFADPKIWDGTADVSWYESSAQAYNITTAEQLAGLAKMVNEGNTFKGKTVILGADIFLNDTAGVTDLAWISDERNVWTPIGNGDHPFMGEFDGMAGAKKRKIYGLYQKESNTTFAGLFGYVDRGEIKNLDLLSGKVLGGDTVGALIGKASNTPVTNVYSELSVAGNYCVGGLTGYASGKMVKVSVKADSIKGVTVGGIVGFSSDTLLNASVEAIVSGDTAGGLAGINTGAILGTASSNSMFDGAVSARRLVGGIVGKGYDVSRAYAKGRVSGECTFNKSFSIVECFISIGGVAGIANSVKNAFFEGNILGGDVEKYEGTNDIIGASSIGGVAGEATLLDSVHFKGEIQKNYFLYGYDCDKDFFNVGDVYAIKSYTGGLVGKSDSVKNSYAEGEIIGGRTVEFVGGVAGQSVVVNSHFEGNLTGFGVVGGVVADGFADHSYAKALISSKPFYEQFDTGCYDSNKKEYIGITNVPKYTSEKKLVDLVGGVVGVGSAHYSYADGDIEGSGIMGGVVGFDKKESECDVVKNSYSKGNLKSTGMYVGGVVGYIGYTSGCSELSIDSSYHIDGDVAGFAYVGGLVGNSKYDGILNISNSYSEGAVSADSDYAGGLIANLSKGNIMNSHHAKGDVVGLNSVGGIAGYVGGALIESYSIGNVEGQDLVGGLAGYVKDSIVNSYARGNVTGRNTVGGVSGHVEGSIVAAHSTANSISGIFQVGGLVGIAKSTIDSSYATGNVKGDDNVGGLVGSAYADVSNSYARGDVVGDEDNSSAGHDNLGGLVGYQYKGSISNCAAYGNVDGTTKLGGLVGRFDGSEIKQSHANGNVTGHYYGDPADEVGNYYIGGLVGYAKGKIDEIYVSSVVKGIEEEPVYTGCIVGYVNGTLDITNSYYDKTKCNLGVDGGEETASVIGAPAKTTAEMQTKSTYIDWNFEDVWDIVKNSTPYLRMEKGIVIEESSSSGSVVSSSSSESASSSSQQEIASSSSTSRNDELSSSSAAKSSSSSKKKSSSSTKTDAIVASVVPQFSVMVNGRSLQISAARIGATYALFDMQGKVLLQGRVQSANFEIPVACSGNYLIRVGNNVQRIAVK